MSRFLQSLLSLCAVLPFALPAAPFQAGGLVVVVYGGSCSDSTGCPVALAEYDLSTGQLRQTVPLPTTANGANQPFTLEANSAGQLSRSQDGRYLTLAGFARSVVASGGPLLSASAASTVQRVVARIDAAASVDTSTTLGATAFSQVIPRGAATVDGTAYWIVGDNGGVRHAIHGSNDSTQVSGTYARHNWIAAAGGQLWLGPDTNQSRALQIGNLPQSNATNQTEALLAPGTSPGPSSFNLVDGVTLLDVSTDLPGTDLMYAARGGDVVKYRKNAAGGWDQLGGVNTFSAYALAARIKPGTSSVVQIYVNADCGTGTDERICLIEDASGFNGTLASTADSFISPPAAGGFLGVALTPVAGSAGFAIGPAITGAWFDPQQAGHGLFVEVLPAGKFLAWWFTFAPTGEQAWFGGVGVFEDNIAVVPLTKTAGGRFIPNFNAAAITNPAFGTLTLTYTGCNTGKVEFNLPAPYGQGSMNLTRLTLPAGLSCP